MKLSVIGKALLLCLLLVLVACADDEPVTPIRLQVVAMVEAGELGTGADFELVPLPASLASASASGELIVLRDADTFTVVFFTSRGVLDTWEGVVFESDGTDHGDPLAGGGPVTVQALGDGWFQVKAGR